MKSKLLVLSAALMLVLAGCGSKSNDFKPSTDTTPSSSEQETVAVESVSLNQQSATLQVGGTLQLSESILPENASNKNVSWSATGNGVVSVDDGLVTALQAGQSTVTVTTEDGNKTASCNITVEAAQPVDIAYSDGTFEFNTNEQSGKFVYWAGEGAGVSNASYNASTKKYTLTYTPSSWAWYGVQIFYKLPYQEATDLYDIEWVVNSTVAGNITVNGSAKSLVVGDNTISFSNVGPSSGRTLNVQLAVEGGTILGAGTLTFGNPVVYDKTPNASYHRITFAKDQEVLKDIQVKANRLVSAPANPTAPSGQVFAGWYEGSNKFDSTQPVTGAHNYVARFIDEGQATQYPVNVYDGATLLGTIQVIEGSKVDLSSIQFPFGYEASGYYKDSGFQTAFDPATELINGPTNIYAKKQVKVTTDSYNMSSDYVSHLNDGSLQIQLSGWGANVWDVQLNYVLPTGTHNYTINYVYSIDKSGADVQIYDDATKAGPNALTVGNNQSASISYNGTLTTKNKLTFELGALPSGQIATFVLHSITLTIA